MSAEKDGDKADDEKKDKVTDSPGSSSSTRNDEGLGESFDQASVMSDTGLVTKTSAPATMQGIRNNAYDTLPEEGEGGGPTQEPKDVADELALDPAKLPYVPDQSAVTGSGDGPQPDQQGNVDTDEIEVAEQPGKRKVRSRFSRKK